MLATCRSSQRDLASKNILKAFRAHLYPVDATDGRPARECEIVATYTSIEPNEAGEGSPCNTAIRTLIVSLAVLSLAFGIGPPSEWLLGLAEDAAAALLA